MFSFEFALKLSWSVGFWWEPPWKVRHNGWGAGTWSSLTARKGAADHGMEAQ